MAADAGVGPGRGIPDVDGDGHDDLIVAAYLSSAGAPAGGKVTVYSGADGAVLHTVTGAVAGDLLGVDALPLGDVDGDGSQEYLLTAPGLSFGGLDVGHNYVVSFSPPPRRRPSPLIVPLAERAPGPAPAIRPIAGAFSIKKEAPPTRLRSIMG